MTKRPTAIVLACISAASLGLVLLTEKLQAQVLYGSVVGTVTDQSGAVVPKASIAATNVQTGLERATSSESAGVYRILDLPEGTYTIAVSATGFKRLNKTGIQVVIGQVNQQDLQLELGSSQQQVTVQASSEGLQTQKSDVHTTLNSQAIEDLPLDNYRNYQTIELLTPGVISVSAIQRSYPNGVTTTPDRSLAINGNGLPQHMNNTRVDGATDQHLWLTDHSLITPPAETIQEVNVQTANGDVQRGLTAGIAVDIVTKSGTNRFHGSGYAFHDDNSLNAKDFFAVTKPKSIQNVDGVTLGGPIRKNKLFFFGNWDGLNERLGETDLDIVAPLAYRKGDFSSALGNPLSNASGSPINVCTTEGGITQLRQGMVFDPSTGNAADGTGRCVFSSGGALNVIPPGRLYPGALNFWQLMPGPNQPGAFSASTSSNFIINKVQIFRRNTYTVKVDDNISARQTLWIKYAVMPTSAFDPADFGAAGGKTGGAATNFDQLVTIGHTWTPSAGFVATGHAGFTREYQDFTLPNQPTQPLGQTVLGLANANLPVGDSFYAGFPQISIEGLTAMGSTGGAVPFTARNWMLTLAENNTLVHGNHELSFGLEANHNHLNQKDGEFAVAGTPRGSVSTTEYNTFLNLPGAAAGFSPVPANSVAEFDLGLANTVGKSYVFNQWTGKEWQNALYVGDRWRVTPRLTVDIGVRWEYYPLLTRDGIEQFELYDPTTNVLKLGGLGGNPTHLGVTTSHKLFAPRIGLAYRLRDNWVIRAGYGINYDGEPTVRGLAGFYPMSIGLTNFVPTSSVSQYLPYDTFQQGVPIAQNPNLSTGQVTPPSNVAVSTDGPGEFRHGYVESRNLTVQGQLPGQVLLGVGYVGNLFLHELNGVDINAAPLGGGSASQPLANFGRFIQTLQYQGYLTSHYNSLQVTFKRAIGGDVFVQGAYTYSHAISYIDDASYGNGLLFNCPASPAMPKGCLQLNRGAPAFDHTQTLMTAFTYKLPFGTGKRWANSNRAARYVVGGWQTNGVVTAYTGSPLTITQTTAFLNTPDSSQKPDFVGPLTMTKHVGPGQFWFNQNAFSPVQTARFGTSGRGLSWLRGPGVAQLDLSLFRDFKVKERYNLQFRVGALNVTNTPHFSNPNTTCTIVSGACGGTFGQVTSSFGARIIQLGAKLAF